ncbi:MAG TPA: hypothetical protein VMV18_07545 [bacterium]|nr:hypothetical protein [bacterium]
MNKQDKLRLYGQKDYTELIEFPVELVGKDGVVRRYTYEESLLVYAKRIESAHLRYRDTDIADAEVDHCYKRIEQIKRSWKHLAERRVEGNADYAVRYEESAAAECRAFIREYFGRMLADRVPSDEEPIPIYLSLISQDGPMKIFHVSLANRRSAHLLYAFTFAWEPEEGQASARQQFAEWSRLLATGPGGGDDVERLLAAREGKDFGFILTGPQAATIPAALPETEEPSVGGEPMPARARPTRARGAARARVQALLEEDPDNAEAHFAMGRLSEKQGEPVEAYDAFKKCVELSPWYHDAYLRLAVVGDALDEHEEIEPYLMQARHYFPDDDRVLFHLGYVRIRLGKFDDARLDLKRAVELEPANERARKLLDLLEASLRRGADPRTDLAAWRLGATEVPGASGPTRTNLALVALALTIAFAVHAVEAMAGTFMLAAVLAVIIVLAAKPASRSSDT